MMIEKEIDTKPINTLRLRKNARVSSVCFLPKHNHDEMYGEERHVSDSDSDTTDSSDDEDFVLKSRILLSPESTARQTLANQYQLASCHNNGEAHLWDLERNKISFSFGKDSISKNKSSSATGLAVRVVDSGKKLAYQTRNGYVTIFDISKSMMISSVICDSSREEQLKQQLSFDETTFCAMSVCKSNNSMFVIPSTKAKDFCSVIDLRCSTPANTFCVGGNNNNKHGMLMSLAMCESIVACGMEDGSLILHDIRKATDIFTSIKLSQHFILGLDLAPSLRGSMVAIAGLAGNAEDLQDLPESEQGTVAVVKCKLMEDESEEILRPHATLRARVGTCSLTSGGKPGVDVGLFRPDGRIFCVGGWDRRIRIFDRRNAAPLGVLKGYHQDSVTAIDWANNAILASGDNNGKINIWNIPMKCQERGEGYKLLISRIFQ